ncbi:MAG: hypothetical protein ACP5NX_03335 [Candidatus Bilamarchaeaceae archaeon]
MQIKLDIYAAAAAVIAVALVGLLMLGFSGGSPQADTGASGQPQPDMFSVLGGGGGPPSGDGSAPPDAPPDGYGAPPA